MTVTLYTAALPPLRALTVGPDDLEEPQRCVAKARELRINALAVIAYASGHTFFPSAVREDFGLPPIASRFSPECWEELIEAALDERLGLVAIVDLLRAGAPDDPFMRSPFRRRLRQWLVADNAGGVIKSREKAYHENWLIPWNPKVIDYLASLLAELNQSYPVDAVWLRSWHLPQALEKEVPCPTRQHAIELPPRETEEEDDLEAELREPPFEAFFAEPHDQAIEWLMRTLRSRARRGADSPLVVLQATTEDWNRARALLETGLADGLVVGQEDLAQLTDQLVIHSRKVLWVARREIADEHEEQRAGAMPPLGATTGVIFLSQKDPLLPRLAETDAVLDGDEIPEFSSAACWQAIRECLDHLSQNQTFSLFSSAKLEHLFSRHQCDPSLLPMIEDLAQELEQWLNKQQNFELLQGQPSLLRLGAYLRLLLDLHAFAPVPTE
ncbi:MAG: family 10 glycosylhydrolase [Candidatus Sumerlaeaceae bacterium]|jgi:hypothetical protein